MATASGMTYEIIKGSDASTGNYAALFGDTTPSIQEEFLA
jgi:hypothetical protein